MRQQGGRRSAPPVRRDLAVVVELPPTLFEVFKDSPGNRHSLLLGEGSSTSNLDDEVRHIDEMNRQIQADSDAMNAAIQATNAQNAAAQQQIQLQQDLANMPLQQN